MIWLFLRVTPKMDGGMKLGPIVYEKRENQNPTTAPLSGQFSQRCQVLYKQSWKLLKLYFFAQIRLIWNNFSVSFKNWLTYGAFFQLNFHHWVWICGQLWLLVKIIEFRNTLCSNLINNKVNFKIPCLLTFFNSS